MLRMANKLMMMMLLKEHSVERMPGRAALNSVIRTQSCQESGSLHKAISSSVS